MLTDLYKQISECLNRADECARKATAAPTEEMRDDFLRLERNWLMLANNYEFAARLLGFSTENNRRRGEFYDNDSVVKH
jgi:hypothetical protein